MRLQPTRPRLPFVPMLGLLVAMLPSSLAGQPPTFESGKTANDLLREAVANETATSIASDTYLAWMQRVQKPRGTVTKLMVSTPEGILARTVAINGQPLSSEERRQDEEHTNRLLDPSHMREKAKKQHEDQQHVDRLLRALPDALHCDFSAAQPQDGTVRLACAPDPTFSAPNYESQVLEGTQAEIFINRDEKRITRVSATLFKDVSFGWGFLARLKRGGHVEIEQAKVISDRWSLTHLALRFDGHLVIFKPLHLEETETYWNYRAVPSMTVSQALQFLRTAPSP